MALAARARGLEYLAICDHTENVRVVPGLDGDALRRQAVEIIEANEGLDGFRVLRGVECDILPDGSLDLPDDVLAELEWVQISLHAGQRRDGRELTKIISEAMRHPSVCALSHPTGRILNHRPENALDLDEIFAVAVETGVALEINGLPDRLDLSSEHAADALAAGVHLVLSSDAHSTRGLANLDFAVHTARRAVATTREVVNTRSWRALLEERLVRHRRDHVRLDHGGAVLLRRQALRDGLCAENAGGSRAKRRGTPSLRTPEHDPQHQPLTRPPKDDAPS
jgi:DNA polymerase (family 10)